MLVMLDALVEHSSNPEEYVLHHKVRERLEPLSLDGSVQIAKLAGKVLETIAKKQSEQQSL